MALNRIEMVRSFNERKDLKRKYGFIIAWVCGSLFAVEILVILFYPDLWNDFIHNLFSMIGCLGFIYGILLMVWDEFQ